MIITTSKPYQLLIHCVGNDHLNHGNNAQKVDCYRILHLLKLALDI